MKKIIISIILIVVSLDKAIAEDAFLHAKDKKKEIDVKTIGDTTQKKLNEYIINRPEYYFTSSASTLELQYGARDDLFSSKDRDILEDYIQDDIVDSVKYGIERNIRNLEIYLIGRQWILGLLSARIDFLKRKGVVIETPSLNKPLDPFYEERSELKFECGNLAGKSADTLRKRILCFEESVAIKRHEEAHYKFRLRPGFDIKTNIDSDLNLAPAFEPYLEMHLKRFDAKLSYSVPVTLSSHKRKRNDNLFSEISDAFFDEGSDKNERFQFRIEKFLLADYMNLGGNYQFERDTDSHFVGLGSQFVRYPYRISASSLFELRTTRPRVVLSIERVVGKIALGITGNIFQDQDRSWDYQMGARTQVIW